MQRNIYILRERETVLEIGQKYKDKNIIGHITFIILRETILEIGQKYCWSYYFHYLAKEVVNGSQETSSYF